MKLFRFYGFTMPRRVEYFVNDIMSNRLPCNNPINFKGSKNRCFMIYLVWFAFVLHCSWVVILISTTATAIGRAKTAKLCTCTTTVFCIDKTTFFYYYKVIENLYL